ncbi:MAG: UPF0280 family protein [Deltaproteobacteria bacterium]|nr:MAG: UPF0280 family protein [Deltaproteobacteria bacterium]
MSASTYHQEIIRLDDLTIRADCGPMRLTIQAFKAGRPQLDLARRAARVSFTYLARIARLRKELSRPAGCITAVPDDTLVRQMIDSVRSIGDEDLTPMAAVAGTIADAVADWIERHKVSKVVVNNGGDIAIRLSDHESVTVGVRPRIQRPDVTHLLRLNSTRRAWGVTTSGFGGRSFTRGIASAVTVLAGRASMADAAATAIANACTVKDAAIVRQAARQIDPGTDIPDIDVTVDIGPLDPQKKEAALARALIKADTLVQRKTIIGALMAIDAQVVTTPGLGRFISPVGGPSRNH